MDLFVEPLSKLAQYGIAGIGVVAIVSPLAVLLKTQIDSNKLINNINTENNEFNERKSTEMITHIETMTKMFTDVVIVHLSQEKEAIKDLINSNRETQRGNEQTVKTLERMLTSVDRILAIYDYNKP